MTGHLIIAPEVAAALAADQPVVALESTIIAHGMPWPDNAETAVAVAISAPTKTTFFMSCLPNIAPPP